MAYFSDSLPQATTNEGKVVGRTLMNIIIEPLAVAHVHRIK